MNDHTKDGQKTEVDKKKQQEIGEAAQDEAKAHRTS